MANQVIVTNTGNVQVALTPPPNVQVQISRAAIGTVSNVPTANFANYAANVTSSSQPNITSLGTLTTLSATGTATFGNVVVIGNLQVGNLVANTANFANFAGEAFNVSGSNVTGTVANANYAVNAGNATIANSANSVTLANVSGAGNIASINLDGNASNILFGNGTFSAIPVVSNVANANYANFAGTAFSVSGSNVSGEVANAAYANAANTANLATFATTANSVAGANVSGTVANATFALDAGNSNLANTANSVALANVVGIGNIANINLDGSSSNVLFGNGVFAPESTSIANANYANFAGTAFSVSGSNVSGEVANANFASYANLASTANLATFATTANSVAGANVSGEVANANYSSYANIAATANSVALANVVGIGNIANINLDGSSSNVLFGNGVFAPESTSIANANYANFAGTLINGTSNITIPSANGNILFSANSNANLVSIETGGILINTAPLLSQNNGLRITSVGRGGNAAGASRIYWAKQRGTIASPLSVEPSDFTAEILTTGSNGTAQQSSSPALIRAQVDSSYTANGANIPLGWQIVVNDTNGGINNQSKIHNFYSNGNVSFANTIFGNSLSVSGNVTGNYIIGNGSSLSSLTGANVTGEVANANYSSYANIAATANSVAVANVVGIGNIATINLDGSSSNVLYGNGVFAPESTSIANANYANFAGTLINGNSNITMVANSTILISAAGNANVMTVDGNGSIFINPLGGGFNNLLRLNNYGTTANGQNASRINSTRYRGNSTTPLSVQPNDGVMDLLAVAYNGTGLATGGAARFKAVVDNSYTANGANIPLGWQVQVNDTNGGVNNQAKIHNFYANGNVTFANAIFGNSLSVTGNVNGGNILASGNIQGDKILSNSYIEAPSYVQANTFNANYSVSVGNGAVSNAQIFLNGDKTTGCGVLISDGQFSVGMSNIDPTTGFSPFFFSTYSSAYASVSPIRYFRARGIDFANRTSVTAGDYVTDQVSSVYADSGNTYFDVASQNIIVTNNNGAGNVTANLNFSMNNIGSNINFSAGNTYANNFNANNVSVNSNGFMKLASYTEAALTAITGQIGWMAAVSDSARGGNPNGMIAFWDTST
jgi:hypothetical protein